MNLQLKRDSVLLEPCEVKWILRDCRCADSCGTLFQKICKTYASLCQKFSSIPKTFLVWVLSSLWVPSWCNLKLPLGFALCVARMARWQVQDLRTLRSPIGHRCDDGLFFTVRPALWSFNPTSHKTWIWNDRFGFLEVRITNIYMHIEQTQGSVAWKRNSRLPSLCKYPREKDAIVEKFELATDNAIRAFKLDCRLTKITTGSWGYSSVKCCGRQLYNDVKMSTQLDIFHTIVASIVLCVLLLVLTSFLSSWRNWSMIRRCPPYTVDYLSFPSLFLEVSSSW